VVGRGSAHVVIDGNVVMKDRELLGRPPESTGGGPPPPGGRRFDG
jgi:hypothetical protein